MRQARAHGDRIRIGTMAALLLAFAAAAGEEARREIIRLPKAEAVPEADGRLETAALMERAVVLGGSFERLYGKGPRPGSPTVYLMRSATDLYVGVDNPLGEGERPTMWGAIPDTSGICMGNALEIFIMPPTPEGELLSYVQFIGNARGCVYDAITRPEVGVTYVAEFNLPWKYGNRIVPGHWTNEVSIPFAELGIDAAKDGAVFDLDVGRDGGGGPHTVHSYAMAYHNIQKGEGIKIVLDDEAPAVQWLRFGTFHRNRLDPELRLVAGAAGGKYTARVRRTAYEPKADGTHAEVSRREKTFRLEPGETATWRFEESLPPEEKGYAHYLVLDEAGETVFYRKVMYYAHLEKDLHPLYVKAEPKPLAVEARMAPSYGRFVLGIDIIDYAGEKEKVAVVAEAFAEGKETPLATERIETFHLDYATALLGIGETIPEGSYEVRFRMVDRETDEPLGPTASVKLTRTIHPWEGNEIGLSDTPPPPWLPVQQTGETFRVWGRDYRFTGLALPASIPTLQREPTRGPALRDVLAGPVRLVAETGDGPVAWDEGASCRVVEVNDNEAVLEGGAASDALAATVRGRLEYDGFYRVTLRIEPKTAADLASIRVEVPLPTPAARLFHSVGESMRTNKTFADFADRGDGVLWSSKKAAKNATVKGNFLPSAWLGDEDRGLHWLCNTDRSWVLDDEKACLDVVRAGGETVFRMHLLNRPGPLEQPIEVTFGLQATPVRSRPLGGSWKTKRWWGWGYFDKPLIYDGCFEGIEKPGDLAPEAWYRSKEARRNNQWWRYFSFAGDRISPKDPTYGQFIQDFGAEWTTNGYSSKFQNRSHQDFEMWAYKQWCDIASMDGIYYDNTFPAPQPNLANGMAYRDASGTVHPGYSVLEKRDFMKRVRTFFTLNDRSPALKSHITDAPVVGFLGFADIWLDGENGGYAKKNAGTEFPDFVDRWYNPTGMANLRITLGRQFGPWAHYLYNWANAYTVLGQFDLEKGYRAIGRTPYHRFGRNAADVRFHPYWDVAPPASAETDGEDVLVASWTRPGRLRVLVSNMNDAFRDVTVRIDPDRAGLRGPLVAVDERLGTAHPIRDNRVGPLRIASHEYDTFIVAEAGLYTPLPADFGAALIPAGAVLIDKLSDSFDGDTLDGAWTMRRSPKRPALAYRHRDTQRIHKGMLRLLTGQQSFMHVSRPFGRETATVVVTVRAPGCDNRHYSGGFGPGLMLYWDKGTVLAVRGWEHGAPHRKLAFRCTGAVDGKPVLSGYGDEHDEPALKPDHVNVIRIDLKPETVAAYASTDGRTWRLLCEKPRTGFEGAPSHLFLGHGHGGEEPMLMNDSSHVNYNLESHFDDLRVYEVFE